MHKPARTLEVAIKSARGQGTHRPLLRLHEGVNSARLQSASETQGLPSFAPLSASDSSSAAALHKRPGIVAGPGAPAAITALLAAAPGTE
jgi:hypothetical protein